VEAGRRAGGVREVRVDSLADRVAECVAGQARAVQIAEGTCAMVVLAVGDGLIGVFRSLGADVVRADPSDPAAVSGIVSAIESAPARTVFVIPNAADAARSIDDAMAHGSKDVVVVAADSIPAGVAAATAFNPIGSRQDNATAMGEAAERVRSAALATVATTDAVDVVTGLLGERPELITVVAGAAATDDDRDAVVGALVRSFPDLEVHVVDGGQPGPPFLIGVE
jgi:fatty acid kinase